VQNKRGATGPVRPAMNSAAQPGPEGPQLPVPLVPQLQTHSTQAYLSNDAMRMCACQATGLGLQHTCWRHIAPAIHPHVCTRTLWHTPTPLMLVR
jgi:hypothetical protein